MTLRAAIYSRVSTEDQVEGYSLDAQLRACRGLAQERGWQTAAEFIEEGRSARTDDARKRPEFQRLMRAAEAHDFDVLIVHKLDRFSRHLRTTLDAFDRLARAGVAFVSVSEHIDYSTPSGRLFLTMLGGLAQWFSDNLATEVRKGKGERRAQGLYNGWLPYGYQREKDRPVALIEDREAEGVRLAFRMAAQSQSARQIAEALNAAGHRTRGPHGSNPWMMDSVRALLRNRFYLGELPGGAPGTHPPLISPDDYDAAQAAMSARANSPRSLCVKRAARRFSVTGLMVCGKCGAHVNVLSYRDSARAYCSARRQRGACDQRTLTIGVIEQQIEEWLGTLRVDPAEVERAIANAEREQRQPDDTEVERRRLTGRLERLKNLYLLGDVGDAEYRAERADVLGRLADLPKRLDTARIDIENTATMANDALMFWQLASATDRNALLLALCEKIAIDDDRVEVYPRPEVVRLVPSSNNRRRRDSCPSVTARYVAPHCEYPPDLLAELAATARETSIIGAARLHRVSRQEVKRALAEMGVPARRQSVLTAIEAAEIRAAPRGYGTGLPLAARYGVSPSTITAIRKGRQWVVG